MTKLFYNFVFSNVLFMKRPTSYITSEATLISGSTQSIKVDLTKIFYVFMLEIWSKHPFAYIV